MLVNLNALLWIDYAILALCVILTLQGLVRGAASELFFQACWWIALIIGLNFAKDFSVLFEHYFEQQRLRVLIALVLLVCMTLVIGLVTALAMGETLLIQGFSFFSRLLGAVLGGAKAIPVITFLVLIAGMTPLPYDAWWRESQLLAYFQSVAVALRDFVSTGVAQFINYE